MSLRVRQWLFLFSIIAVVLVADQITKRLIVHNLELYETVQPIPAISNVFQLTRSENIGAAFGFLPQAGDLFLIIAIVVTIAMIYFYPRIPDDNLLARVAIGLVVGGALGNAADRIQYGHVVDFIHYRLSFIGISNVSNLADHAIVFGVGLVFLDSWCTERAQKRQQTESSATESIASTDESTAHD